MHYSDPATRAPVPVRSVDATPGKPSVALLDTPVRIHEELRRAHAGNPEDGERRRDTRARHLQLESVEAFLPRESRHPDQYHGREKCQKREERDLYHCQALDTLITAAEQQHQCEGEKNEHPALNRD